MTLDDDIEVFRPTRKFSEYHFYSFAHDKEMVRLSAFDARGQEHYAYLPTPETDGHKLFRERRRTAQAAIEAHIDGGSNPGIVAVSHAR